MALNIKDRETEEVVRRLAQRTGLSITQAVKQAAADKLRRMETEHAERIAQLTPEQLVKLRKLEEISKRAAALPVYDDRPADEILGYDERGIWK